MPTTAAVTVEGLVRRFGALVAADEMSWAAPVGAVTAVLGPNGAGKSTAVECAVGLQRPDGGSVRVLGADPWRSPAEHRARVGVMLQSGGLPTGTTPLRLLRHLASLYADPVPVDELAGRLGIDRFAGTTVRRLSGGQRQRVALAAALVGRPDVVFLDEPTAGLDPHGRLDVHELLEEVRSEGTTVVVTTHSFEEAERLADHLVIVSEGRTMAQGPSAEVVGAGSLETLYFELTRRATR
ncbi:MAG: ABC transporter ATP-binding protein [Actinomycetota bacterium]|nr:ABC transporter ATP-binding protein [Actinomycetota bacterium]